MEVVKATQNHIKTIISIAYDSWNDTYRKIISQEQIDYMLQLFYNEKTLQEQMQHPQHHFFAVIHNGAMAGYAHCIEDEADTCVVKLSKLYVLPYSHGKGIGRLLLQCIENECRVLKKSIITLNVNRKNPAKDFYLKQEFKVTKEVDIPLGQYWLNDYVMQKNLEI